MSNRPISVKSLTIKLPGRNVPFTPRWEGTYNNLISNPILTKNKKSDNGYSLTNLSKRPNVPKEPSFPLSGYSSAELNRRANVPKNPSFPSLNSSKAYVIAGHGLELPESFIVPKGCTIVVDAHIGESQYESKLNENYNKLCTIDDYKLKDPVTYSSDLLSEFKSLAIYKEGEECPQFSYQLVGCHLSPYYACDELNGIIDIDTFKQLGHCDIRRTQYSTNDLNYVSSLYQYSTYPTKYEVEETLKSINLTTSRNSLLGTLLGHKLTNVSQEELCKKMPGVYYNFICRGTELTSEINRNRNRTGINREPKSIFMRLKPEHILRNTISKKISEAERHRKPYIKKANNNNNATIRQQINTLKNTQNLFKRQLNGKMNRALNTDDVFLSNQYLQNQIKEYNKRISLLNNTLKASVNVKAKANNSKKYNKVTLVNNHGKNKVTWVKKANNGK